MAILKKKMAFLQIWAFRPKIRNGPSNPKLHPNPTEPDPTEPEPEKIRNFWIGFGTIFRNPKPAKPEPDEPETRKSDPCAPLLTRTKF